jgi:hypothetical protein
VFGGGRPSLSSVSIREALNGVFMKRYGDGDGPSSPAVRDALVADRVEKSAAYPVLLAHVKFIFTNFSRSFHATEGLSRDLRVVKVSIY